MDTENFFDTVIKPHPLFNSNQRCDLIELLYPPFAERVIDAMYALRQSGIEVGVFETYRSSPRQLKLYVEKRTKIKSNGMHHYGVACDLVPKVGGQWKWDVGQPTWQKIGSVGKRNGLTWGGDWKTFVDSPHFQAIPVSAQSEIRALNYSVIKLPDGTGVNYA